MLPLKVNERVLYIPKAPGQKPHYQMQFSVLSRKLDGGVSAGLWILQAPVDMSVFDLIYLFNSISTRNELLKEMLDWAYLTAYQFLVGYLKLIFESFVNGW